MNFHPDRKPPPRQSSTTEVQSGNVSATCFSWAPGLCLPFVCFTFLLLSSSYLSLFSPLFVFLFPNPIFLPQLPRWSLNLVLFMAFLHLGEKQKALCRVSALIPAWHMAAVPTKHTALLSKIPTQPPSRRKTDPSQLAAFSSDAHCRVDTSIVGKTLTQHHPVTKMCLRLSHKSPVDWSLMLLLSILQISDNTAPLLQTPRYN